METNTIKAASISSFLPQYAVEKNLAINAIKVHVGKNGHWTIWLEVDKDEDFSDKAFYFILDMQHYEVGITKNANFSISAHRAVGRTLDGKFVVSTHEGYNKDFQENENTFTIDTGRGKHLSYRDIKDNVIPYLQERNEPYKFPAPLKGCDNWCNQLIKKMHQKGYLSWTDTVQMEQFIRKQSTHAQDTHREHMSLK